ncbi:MAG TPA: hypothetical protein VKB93_28320 [Thermoanaerobaculia bacterium]|nr:hypothetical protein [Thermoanaerobaculia bacterium]
MEESIREAVDREAARRKRTLYAFLALLLVPIAIGAYALSRAPKEAEQVANDVTPIVTERVAKDVVERSEPLIKEKVSRETGNLRSDIAKLQTMTRKQEQTVTALQARITPADNSALLRELRLVRAQLTELQDRVEKLEEARRPPVPR